MVAFQISASFFPKTSRPPSSNAKRRPSTAVTSTAASTPHPRVRGLAPLLPPSSGLPLVLLHWFLSDLIYRLLLPVLPVLLLVPLRLLLLFLLVLPLPSTLSAPSASSPRCAPSAPSVPSSVDASAVARCLSYGPGGCGSRTLAQTWAPAHWRDRWLRLFSSREQDAEMME